MDGPLHILTFTGRADRLEYAWNLGFALLGAPILFMALEAVGLRLQLLGTPFFGVWLCFVVLHMAATVRRFHDVGHPAILPLALLILPVLLTVAPVLMLEYCSETCFGPVQGVGDDGRGIGSAILTAYLAISLFPLGTLVFLTLAFWRSAPGPNRYGPPPSEVTQ